MIKKKAVVRSTKLPAAKTRLLFKRVAQVITRKTTPHRRVLEMLTLPTRTAKKLKNERVKARL